MCNHLISKNGWRTPEDYADTFRVMMENGAFDSEFLRVLMSMARFRNRLIHIYWSVDNAEVYRILSENLGDLERFLLDIGGFMGRDIAG
ncbi:MAG: type VII toxin-antitoxin system HepT family RNase toxin [bacterium]